MYCTQNPISLTGQNPQVYEPKQSSPRSNAHLKVSSKLGHYNCERISRTNPRPPCSRKTKDLHVIFGGARIVIIMGLAVATENMSDVDRHWGQIRHVSPPFIGYFDK